MSLAKARSMMMPNCIYGCIENAHVLKNGRYFRNSDKRWIRRFVCLACRRSFSKASLDPCFRQKKRSLNVSLQLLLASGLSLRRAAIIFKVHRKTVERRLRFLGRQSSIENKKIWYSMNAVKNVQFDDLETIEHTKLKPLSVSLAVEKKTRKIIGFEVSQMPSKGHLSRKSILKYGRRADDRPQALDRLFFGLKSRIRQDAIFESDKNPIYAAPLQKYFPLALHQSIKGARGSLGGQGELKKLRYDPLFSLNHTCAMLRANINRLFRKTWCTTKDRARLLDHLNIYAFIHNSRLTGS